MCQQRKAIYLPRSMDRGIDHMSDEQLGDVMRAVLLYDLDGTIMDFGDNVVGQVMFETLILPWMEECNAKVAHRAEYSSRGGKECQRRRKAAKERVEDCGLRVADCAQSARVEDCGLRVEGNVRDEERGIRDEGSAQSARVEGCGETRVEETEGDEENVGDEDCEEDAVEDCSDIGDVFYSDDEDKEITRVEGSAQSARVEDCGLIPHATSFWHHHK